MDTTGQLIKLQQGLRGRKTSGGYLPVAAHTHSPVPMPLGGGLSHSAEEATERLREVLRNSLFTAGWVISTTDITEVAL